MAKYQGYLAEFGTADLLIEAARKLSFLNYKNVEAFTPFPIEELDGLFSTENSVAKITFLGGLTGFAVGIGMQVYSAAYDYPLQVGGRPLLSWPAFIPVTFELTVLFASISAILAFLISNRLPRLNFPLFEISRFERSTQDRFFLFVHAGEKEFSSEELFKHLQSFSPESIEEVNYED